MSVSLERLVRNQVIFREVNDRIREVTNGFGVADPIDFICECSGEGCTESVSLTAEEYERVRSSATLFVIVPGHETLEVEQIVDANERFILVEKVKHTDKVIDAYESRST
jgi:hypothetical protein